MDSESVKIIIRAASPNDKSFIMASWLKGNYYNHPYFGLMPADIYFKEYASHISGIFSDENTRIDIACDSNQPNWIVGFIVFTGSAVHWIYTKKDYRNKGIARLLSKDKAFTQSTSVTKPGQAIMKKMGLIFNPMKAGINGK